MLRGPQGLNALAEKHRQIRLLQEENDRIAHEIELKRARILRLQGDPATQEVELEKMGLLHRHDTQFRSADKSMQVGVGQPITPAANSGAR